MLLPKVIKSPICLHIIPSKDCQECPEDCLLLN